MKYLTFCFEISIISQDKKGNVKNLMKTTQDVR